MSRVKVSYVGYVRILVHRVLAQHKPTETCPECPTLCHHCGDVGKSGDDHTCPCPFSDADCTEHPTAKEASEQ